MHHDFHVFPDGLFVVLSLTSSAYLASRAMRLRTARSPLIRGAILTLACLLSAVVVLGYILLFVRFGRLFNVAMITWIQAAALIYGIQVMAVAPAVAFLRRIPFRSERREVLQIAGALVVATPLTATTFGIVHRNDFRLSEVAIPFPGLPRDLDGLRLVQITDIHMSAFLSERDLARAIDMANEAGADVALVTGDLITRGGDPVDACLRQLARLRARAGVFGCMGNHEVYAGVQPYVTAEAARRGIRFLRHEAASLRFGDAALNLGGVDYQRIGSHYLPGCSQLIAPGQFNILLSHNPDVFPVAAGQGWDLTISGHTHGGQINVEILHQDINVARYFTPFVRGIYRRDNAAVYVSRGLGTVGLPVRLGAQPEVSVVRLCAI